MRKMHYYNEWEPYAAQWLRNLISAKLIPDGDVDERSIRDVKPEDLRKYTQCHFFAGLGGWPLALRLAGWDESKQVWTGSCPCQPFSGAGKRMGEKDERHLWPQFKRLIEECAPSVVFGEQTESKDGRLWLSRVQADLEALGYASAAADLCAAGVSAPHRRQRLYWVAESNRIARRKERPLSGGLRKGGEAEGVDERLGRGGPLGVRMEHADGGGRRSNRESGGLSEVRPGEADQRKPSAGAGALSRAIGLADTEDSDRGSPADQDDAGRRAAQAGRSGRPRLPWDEYAVVPCADGKSRRIEPGVRPLAHGVLQRVGKLRAYGNAIVPWVAAEFIQAYNETKV